MTDLKVIAPVLGLQLDYRNFVVFCVSGKSTSNDLEEKEPYSWFQKCHL